ncbi:hypothetical protein [Flavobacterium branchiophilum]|uniref:Lipoprotein n=1 Tax=Flavobacterium branchiophilum TaxID=55197 RepID=A0A2H3KAT6_9FLAO|nr:hypothetical protein [Flavobacterium branchiophilum]PDS23866.1 hypothetical protein B0A77_09760 [Flavobacterium branchiophilum]
MKKILLSFAIGVTLVSCSKQEPYQSIEYYNTLPVESVVMPTTFKVDSVSNITLKYRKPTTCYVYQGLYYEKNGFTRTVAINTINYEHGNCITETQNLYETAVNFRPVASGTYTFKFWTGTTAGVDQFATYQAIVP